MNGKMQKDGNSKEISRKKSLLRQFDGCKMNKANQEIQIANAIMPDFENPDRIFERKELQDKIRCLPPSFARPLKLYLAGYAYKEIAKMTNVPIGTVKSRIHLAKEKLKKAYGASC
jgi:RNA polymerase sigma factor (sigma-70 family)